MRSGGGQKGNGGEGRMDWMNLSFGFDYSEAVGQRIFSHGAKHKGGGRDSSYEEEHRGDCWDKNSRLNLSLWEVEADACDQGKAMKHQVQTHTHTQFQCQNPNSRGGEPRTKTI